jgi:hypothetical protein
VTAFLSGWNGDAPSQDPGALPPLHEADDDVPF